MSLTAKKIAKSLLSFACEQYLIIYFVLAIGLKLMWFNANVIKVDWSPVLYTCGVIFGFLIIAILFSPLLFIKKRKNLFAIILASIICILILVDHVYYSYFSALPTMGILSNAGEAVDVIPAIMTLLEPILALYIFDIILIIVFYKQINYWINNVKNKFELPKTKWKTSLLVTGLIVIVAGTFAANMRGDASLEYMINRSYGPTTSAQSYSLLGSHIIDIARFVIQETSHLSDEQVQEISTWIADNKPSNNSVMMAKMSVGGAKTSVATTDLSGIAAGKNIIMIQVESLGGFAINQTIEDQAITPNLNKLATESYYYPNAVSTISGGHTSDADFTVNTSYFPFDDAAVFVRFGQDNFTSLPKNLIKNGYSAYAYHGFNRNFWNRNATYSSIGYQKFYAADNYQGGTKINMGLDDDTFLTQTAEYIAKQPKPSFSYVVTLSSHVPFSLPDNLKGLDIDTDAYREDVGNYLLSINYTDRMLGKFFEKLKSAGLYDDSLIVVYGDHNPVMDSFTAGTVTYDSESAQNKEVPMFIKLPNSTESKTITKTATQLDIMPTILDLAGISTNDLMFGRSLATDSSNNFTTCANQIAVFGINSDCETMLETEKSKSADIIRYNLFDKISN